MKRLDEISTFRQLFALYQEHMRRGRARFTKQMLAKQLGISMDELKALEHQQAQPTATLARRLLALLESLKA
jgi:DNA-binding XRE family transcriptional regulator